MNLQCLFIYEEFISQIHIRISVEKNYIKKNHSAIVILYIWFFSLHFPILLFLKDPQWNRLTYQLRPFLFLKDCWLLDCWLLEFILSLKLSDSSYLEYIKEFHPYFFGIPLLWSAKELWWCTVLPVRFTIHIKSLQPTFRLKTKPGNPSSYVFLWCFHGKMSILKDRPQMTRGNNILQTGIREIFGNKHFLRWISKNYKNIYIWQCSLSVVSLQLRGKRNPTAT